MILVFTIDKQIITRRDNEKVVRDSVNYLHVNFSFSEEWTGDKTAVFKSKSGIAYNVLVGSDGSCLVPWEVLKEEYFEVSAFCGDLITANVVKVFTIPSGYEIGSQGRIPTPDIYTQIIARLSAIEAEIDPTAIQQVVDEYLSDKDYVTEHDVEQIVADYIEAHKDELKGDTGATGPQGPQGEQGPKGDTGEGVAAGGTTGQVLVKSSDADYDTEWGTVKGSADIDGLEPVYDYELVTPTVYEKTGIRINTGAEMTNNFYNLAEVSVVEGEIYNIVGTTNSTIALCIIKDSDGNVLYSYPTSEKLNTLVLTEGIRVTIPEGGAKLYSAISRQSQYKHAIYKVIDSGNKEITNKFDVLYNKKWYVLGDSFTFGYYADYTDSEGHTGQFSDAFDDILGCFKTYPWWIQKRCGIKANLTLSMGGIDFTNITDAVQPFSADTSPRNYTMIPNDCDYITLAFGLNEWNLTAEQIGTKTDTTNETLWGAYNVVLTSILTNNPKVKIGIIITDAWMGQTYHDALIEIAKYWGIPYLDLRNGEQVPMMINGKLREHSAIAEQLRDSVFQISTNNHPTLEGHKYRSTVIENFLRSL